MGPQIYFEGPQFGHVICTDKESTKKTDKGRI